MIEIAKIIFRIDFPTNFEMLDSFGKLMNSLEKKSNTPYFLKKAILHDSPSKKVILKAENDDCQMQLTNNLSTYDGVIEFITDYKSSTPTNNPFFKLAQSHYNKIADLGIDKFVRVGARFYVLVKNEKFTFTKLKKYFDKKMSDFSCEFDEHFKDPYDSSIIIERENSVGEVFHLQFGPYRKEESAKYYQYERPEKEALFFDVDIWQLNFRSNNFDIEKLMKNRIKALEGVVTNISNTIIKEI